MTLLEYMKAERLTLTRLSARLERPLATVHAWLNGGRLPDAGVLAEIERRTGGLVTPADLRPDLAALFRPSHASQDASGRDGVQAP